MKTFQSNSEIIMFHTSLQEFEEHFRSFHHMKGLVQLKGFELFVCEYLRSDLCSLLGIDCAHMLVVFQRVLPVLLLCTDILLQQAQHLTCLVVAVLYGDYCTYTPYKNIYNTLYLLPVRRRKERKVLRKLLLLVSNLSH